MTEAKKRKLHSAEFKAKVSLEASCSRKRTIYPVNGIAALTDMTLCPHFAHCCRMGLLRLLIVV